MKTDKQKLSQINRQTLTVDEFAKVLGIGRGHAYAAVRRGEVETIKIGRRILISQSALQRLLDGRSRLAKSK